MDFLREIVGGPKNRFKEFGYNLDLTYITNRVIAMAFPASGIEKLYRNSVDSIRQFLQNAHQNKYITINISGREIEDDKLQNVKVYDWEDHKSPSFETLFLICHQVALFLNSDPDRVAVFHCNHGKGRTGTIICCFFLFIGLFKEPLEAMKFYSERRFATEGYGVTQPCQIKYIEYFHHLLSEPNLKPKVLALSSVKFKGEFYFKEPYIKVYQMGGKELLYNSKQQGDTFKQSSDTLSLKPKRTVAMAGDILVQLKESKAIGTNLIISYVFHTAFIINTKELQVPLRQLSPLGKQDQNMFGPSFTLNMGLSSVCNCGQKKNSFGCGLCHGVIKGEIDKWSIIQKVLKERDHFRTKGKQLSEGLSSI